jgi:predicted methyltransferase
MLEAAERALAGSDVATSVVMGDLYDPQWVSALPQPREFDVVMSRHAIHHLPDDRKVALYAEIFGLLRPGGVFVNIEHVKSRALPYQQAFDQVMIESIHALAPAGQRPIARGWMASSTSSPMSGNRHGGLSALAT